MLQEIESLTDPIERQVARAEYKVAPPREQILLVRRLRDQHSKEVDKIHEVSARFESTRDIEDLQGSIHVHPSTYFPQLVWHMYFTR